MRKIFLIALCSLTALTTSCKKDGLVDGISTDLDLSFSVDKSTAYVGQEVTFRFNYEAASLALFTGDAGYDYANSYYVLMDGLSEEEMKDDVYLNVNDDITPYEFSFADYQNDSAAQAAGFDLVRGDVSTTDPSSQLGSNGSIEDDGGVWALNANGIVTTGWNDYMRFDIIDDDGTKYKPIDTDKTLKLRMRFDVESSSADFQLLCSLKGIDINGNSQTVKYGVYDNRGYPSTSYTDYEFDLSTDVAYWESKALYEMVYIEQINIIVRDINGADWTQYWVSEMSFGGNGYYSMSTGHSVSTSNSSGVATYSYTYDKAGTYDVVAVAVNNGIKTTDELRITIIDKEQGGSNPGMGGSSGDLYDGELPTDPNTVVTTVDNIISDGGASIQGEESLFITGQATEEQVSQIVTIIESDTTSSDVTLQMPEVTAIGENTFNGCTSIANISLPSVEALGDGAFSNLSGVSILELATSSDSEITSWGNDPFAGTETGSIALYLGEGNRHNVSGNELDITATKSGSTTYTFAKIIVGDDPDINWSSSTDGDGSVGDMGGSTGSLGESEDDDSEGDLGDMEGSTGSLGVSEDDDSDLGDMEGSTGSLGDN